MGGIEEGVEEGEEEEGAPRRREDKQQYVF